MSKICPTIHQQFNGWLVNELWKTPLSENDLKELKGILENKNTWDGSFVI